MLLFFTLWDLGGCHRNVFFLLAVGFSIVKRIE